MPDPHSDEEPSDQDDESSSSEEDELEVAGTREGTQVKESAPREEGGKVTGKRNRLPPRQSGRKKKKIDRLSPEKVNERPKIPPRSRRRSKLPPNPLFDEEEEEDDDSKGAGKTKGVGKTKATGRTKAARKTKAAGKTNKKEPEQAQEPVVSTGVEALLQKLLQQQAELIQLMHEKDKTDHEKIVDVEDADRAAFLEQLTTKKPPIAPRKSPGRGQQRYVDIAPQTFVGDHSMEMFLRNNVQMARLIDENAQLRRDRLVQDLIKGAADYHHV